MDKLSLFWIGFNVFVLGMLMLDLGVFHKKSKAVSVREALAWSGLWISLALVFNVILYYQFGQDKALEFLTGFVIEKSLSVDNIFVMIVIFSYFRVPAAFQHKVLFWGILGALVFRIVFILAGVELIASFHWLIYLFGGFLIITGIRLLRAGDESIEPEKNPLVKLVRKLMPVTPDYIGNRFFVHQDGRWWATPLFIVVVVIEATDIVFAVDSIPAILAISTDSFIVYTSNVFAILGLRSLYFAVAGIQQYFVHLKYGLSVILVFVGTKMLLVDYVKIPVEYSLLVIASVLLLSVLASVVFPGRKRPVMEPVAAVNKHASEVKV
jgi:tellurite resistance protein TerC